MGIFFKHDKLFFPEDNNKNSNALLILALCCTVIFISPIKAQQLPFYSQYRNNAFLFNPAIAGTKQTIDLRSNYRMQWVGFEGAPTTSSMSFHSRLYQGGLGLGGFIVMDEVGPNKQTHYNISGAYHIRFPDVELSIAGGGYFTHYTLDGNKMTLRHGQDPSINTNILSNVWTKNVGTGVYLYNDRFNFGLSALHYLQPKINVFQEDTTKSGVVKYATHANFIFGYNYAFDENYMCENNFYANYVVGAPILLDYTFRFHIINKLLIGGSVRLRDALVFHVGFTFFKQLQICYSYDLLISKFNMHSTGTHEASIIFSYDNNKHNTKRFLKQKYSHLF